MRYQKPLLVVERDSHTEIMNVLKEIKSLPPLIVFCFTGTPEEIITYVDKGFYIGVTGYVCKGITIRTVAETELQKRGANQEILTH